MLVTPPQPFFRATTAQRSINRCRRDKDLTVPIDVNDRALKLFRRDFRKAFRDLLVRCVLNFSAGNYAPALDPAPAKVTFAIPNQERLGQGIGNAGLLFHELSGGSHVPSHDPTSLFIGHSERSRGISNYSEMVWRDSDIVCHPEGKRGTTLMVVDHTSQVEHCIHVCEIPPRLCASG